MLLETNFYNKTIQEGLEVMNYIVRNLRHLATASIAIAIGLAAVAAYGQDGKYKDKNKTRHSDSRSFCSDDDWSSNGRVAIKDLREITLPATSSISVDSGRNGGISVKGEDRSDILVRACVQAWGDTAEAAKALASSIRISTAGTIKADNGDEERSVAVSYQVIVPRSIDLTLAAHNGGISIKGVNGTAEFETRNGGIHLSDVSGNVKGRTTNGGVHVVLTGATWRGSGLDLVTTNGGVHLAMPRGYAAHLETGTVNGGFNINVPGVDDDVPLAERRRSTRISRDINGGGPTVRIMTTNGGVKIGTSDD